ncbi:MAG TPA: hypothetical protein VFJ87_10645 [Rhodanobacteraceae bacterium]|nr:hypothetical protein [Rhodanobacteraceae bacterium]
MYAQILNSVGLILGAFGAVLMFLGTWGKEPEPALSAPELIKVIAEWNDVATLAMTFPSPEAARKYRAAQIDDALHSAGHRNQRRRKLNRFGLGLLITGFVLQLVATWL